MPSTHQCTGYKPRLKSTCGHRKKRAQRIRQKQLFICQQMENDWMYICDEANVLLANLSVSSKGYSALLGV